ncbi:hypothetical protein V5O48_004515 [Marasmius crinis-equi]|uniref:DUF7330 domain-containing protein n=1 Tax=Marasmius crinis-equi TaxID=585013 RepID=A0ABR3FQB0_9AGAR
MVDSQPRFPFGPPPSYPNSAFSDSGPDLPSKTPCNYTRVVRERGSIEETFVVDHSIRVNEELLPGLTDAQRDAEGGRNNLYVKTKEGDVTVDVHTVKDCPTTRSNNPVDATTRFPDRVKLTAESDKGDVLMRLPVAVTGDLSKITNIISEDGKVRKFVIGELKGPWKQAEKDEIFLVASRRVFLQYVDEEFEKPIVEGECIVA